MAYLAGSIYSQDSRSNFQQYPLNAISSILQYIFMKPTSISERSNKGKVRTVAK